MTKENNMAVDTDNELELAINELERLLGVKHLGVRTSTQFKLGISGVCLIIDALSPRKPLRAADIKSPAFPMGTYGESWGD